MRTIAIINLKGGVAKTTSSINIAYILMRKGYKVLLVDNDKQGDCSRGMNRRTQDGEGIDRIMVDRHPDMEKLINKTDYLHLDIITATLKKRRVFAGQTKLMLLMWNLVPVRKARLIMQVYLRTLHQCIHSLHGGSMRARLTGP